MGDLIDLGDALGQLQMSEEELQNLVARGDLRVVRSRGKMMFHRSDISSLKKERATEPTIIIPASDGGDMMAGVDALNIDLPDTMEVDESAATVVPESGTEEIVFDDSELDILPSDAAATAEVTVSEEPDVPYAMAEAPGAVEEAPVARPSARQSAVSRRLQAAYEVQPGSPIMSAVLVLTTVVMMIAATLYTVILYKGYYDEKNRVKYVPSFLEPFYNSFSDQAER